MEGGHDFLGALAVVLSVAAVTTVLFQRLRQPVVLGYVLAGLLVGPHLPLPLVAEREVVHTLSELGVILLMFSLGLEFSLRKLLAVGPAASLVAVVESSFVAWLGYGAGQLLGWTAVESLFAAAAVAISSTTIVAKAFEERRVGGPLRERVVGVLVAEDLIAVVLIAALTAVASGAGLDARALSLTLLRLGAFLVGTVAVGLLVVPRAVRAVGRLERPETTLVAAVGFCFAVALLAREAGYSVALGAFLAGSLVGESGEEKRIEHLVRPVRDMFAAVFFVSVGMQLDPALVAAHWPAVALLTAVVLAGKTLGVSVGSFLTGSGVRTAVQSGMSLAQIGEFSFIIVGLGLSLGATREALYAVAVSVSVLTTLSTPWLIRTSGSVASFVDHKLPRPLQTFAALYGTWVERLRSASRRATVGARIRRLARLLLVDAGLLALLVVATSLAVRRLVPLLVQKLGMGPAAARLAVLGAGLVLAAPLLAGIVRVGRHLGGVLAAVALPSARSGKVDLALAPRRVLTRTLEMAVLILVGAPLVALTQPFLTGPQGGVVVAALLLVLGVAFWRSAANLQGHVRAGAEIIAEALASQARKETAGSEDEALARVRALLPGIGEPIPVRLAEGDAAVGKTLAQLDLRGATGATVLAIARGQDGVIVPSATEVLRSADVLALAGTHEAVAAAERLLRTGEGAPVTRGD